MIHSQIWERCNDTVKPAKHQYLTHFPWYSLWLLFWRLKYRFWILRFTTSVNEWRNSTYLWWPWISFHRRCWTRLGLILRIGPSTHCPLITISRWRVVTTVFYAIMTLKFLTDTIFCKAVTQTWFAWWRWNQNRWYLFRMCKNVQDYMRIYNAKIPTMQNSKLGN